MRTVILASTVLAAASSALAGASLSLLISPRPVTSTNACPPQVPAPLRPPRLTAPPHAASSTPCVIQGSSFGKFDISGLRKPKRAFPTSSHSGCMLTLFPTHRGLRSDQPGRRCDQLELLWSRFVFFCSSSGENYERMLTSSPLLQSPTKLPRLRARKATERTSKTREAASLSASTPQRRPTTTDSSPSPTRTALHARTRTPVAPLSSTSSATSRGLATTRLPMSTTSTTAPTSSP